MPVSFRSRFYRVLLVPLAVVLTGCGGPDLLDRLSQPQWGLCGTLIIVLDLVAIVDVAGDEARSTTNKLLWALLVIFFPVGGVILYFLLGRE
ncbi:MAG: PLD nuclease N-terminal domain-containing protein [Salinibacter sp.]